MAAIVAKRRLTVLIENVEHHAEEEEQELFPALREKMDESRLQELGAELEAAKEVRE